MLSADLLAGLAGIVLSLIASYLPGFAPWFAKLQADQKRLVMLGALVVVSVAVFVLSCAGILDMISCNKDGALLVLRAFIIAMVSGQSAYLLSPGVVKSKAT